MAENHVLLETIEVVQSGVASVTIDNIPQTGYSDLKVVLSTRSSGTSNVEIRPNGSSSNLSNIRLYSNGATSPSFSGTTVFAYQNRSSFGTGTFDNSEIYIPNYTSSSTYKTISVENVTANAGSNNDMQLQAGLWSQNTAISSLGFFVSNSQTFAVGSTISLYGIASLNTTPTIAPMASGGNIIAQDGTYWYHAFLSSGTFTSTQSITADVLTIGGGGGGGTSYSNTSARGGGGSSPVQTTGVSLTATGYAVTVGGGGTGSADVPSSNATAGGSSTFNSTFTSSGGSAGTNSSGCTGGPGAGGSASGSTGGIGTATYNTWSIATGVGELSSGNYYFGGGGGGGACGGAGGLGGGANGQSGNGTPNAASLNRGGGGGGGGTGGGSGGSGGSGVVIIRYTMV